LLACSFYPNTNIALCLYSSHLLDGLDHYLPYTLLGRLQSYQEIVKQLRKVDQ